MGCSHHRVRRQGREEWPKALHLSRQRAGDSINRAGACCDTAPLIPSFREKGSGETGNPPISTRRLWIPMLLRPPSFSSVVQPSFGVVVKILPFLSAISLDGFYPAQGSQFIPYSCGDMLYLTQEMSFWKERCKSPFKEILKTILYSPGELTTSSALLLMLM